MISETDGNGETTTYRYDANGNRTVRVLNAEAGVVEDSASGENAISIENAVSTENADNTETNATKEKETADYYYYDFEDRLVELVIHNGKVFTYGYDGDGNRLWRTYSQYPLVKPPVDEGERVDDPATFPGNNKDNSDKSNNGNGNGNGNSNGNVNGNGSKNSNNDIDESTAIVDTESVLELFSIAAISGNEELLSSVDTYLINYSADKTDKENNGNSGNSNNNNGNGSSNGNSNGNGNKDNKENGNNGNGNSKMEIQRSQD
jgi:YD repeat-containing protein